MLVLLQEYEEMITDDGFLVLPKAQPVLSVLKGGKQSSCIPLQRENTGTKPKLLISPRLNSLDVAD